MASVQDRLQISRVPMDKWSTREQLCLASAVSCSGDQNWMSVSRTLKLVCGTNRPIDWFSQKCCAVQYGHMLENVETPKRKKRASEGTAAVSGSSVASPGSSTTGGETSTDSILRRLTEERIFELKAEIQKEQEEYAKVFEDLKHIQSGQLDEMQIAEMWKEIEKEQELQRIEEMKMENQLREREQRKQEMHRNWRSTASAVGIASVSGITSSTTTFSQKQDDKQLMDINLEEIIGGSKLSTGIQQQATSPLLSSLLKSPTSGNVATSVGTPAHASAPTITTLLTGGALNPNQPALTLKSTVATNEAVQLLTRPISGPPSEPLNPAATTSQSLLSPSQSAPTLSMLLEKNKSNNNTTSNVTASLSEAALEVKADSLISDSNNEEVPMDIEEDVGAAINSSDLIDPNDSDADANEEQQLLEVFKNIGNIDELADIDVSAVIDEEVDFLKSVGDDNADVEDDLEFEAKMAAVVGMNNDLEQMSKNEFSEIEDLEASKQTNKDIQIMNDAKVETISSDDSNDNIPLATLGSNSSHEFKDNLHKSQEIASDKNKQEKNETEHIETLPHGNVSASPKNVPTPIHLDTIEDEDEDTNTVSKLVSEVLEENSSLLKSPESVSSDVIIIPTDEESNGGKVQTEKLDESKQDPMDNSPAVELDRKNTIKIDERKDEIEYSSLACDTVESSCSTSPTKEMKDFNTVMQAPPPTTISLADTDEDSSTTDISISTKKEEKCLSKSNVQTKKDHKTENKLEEENAINQTPAKIPAVRKLRDRDRSESPLTAVDDDTTASEHSVTQRSRRRYSSTPIIDSIPNSPASSDRDDRDVKMSKKSLISIYNVLITSKNANSFQRAYGEQALQIKQVCNRYVDLHTIKKNIENNLIRNIHELQRDILLMCQNAVMSFETNSNNYKIAYDFMLDCQNIKEFVSNGCNKEIKIDKETKDSRTSVSSYSSSPHSSSVKVRGSSRKSQRIS